MVLTIAEELTEAQRLQAEAREIYRANYLLGYKMTGAELGTKCDRSETWGLDRIREALRELNGIPMSVSVPSTPEDLPPTATPPSLPQMEPAETTAPQEPQQPLEVESTDQATPPVTEAEEAPTGRFRWHPRGRRKPRARKDRSSKRNREPNPQRRGASFASWIAFGLGITMSVAANVAHIWFVTRPDGQAALYAAMILAAFWPLALAVSVEVISRVGYPHGVGWALARFGGIGAVGAVAAVVSYLHMHSLLNYFGESLLSSVVGPLGVDGLLIVGGFALFAIGETRKAAKVAA